MVQFKFSGRIAEHDRRHSYKSLAPDGALVPPAYVTTPWGEVPQYAPTVQSKTSGYAPSTDCQGYFMSYRYQPNNNCYAYGCNIATNSFPQPGRASGGTPFSQKFTAEQVRDNAVQDGLVYVGKEVADIYNHRETSGVSGHYVALMFSTPESSIGGDPSANWPGDYHWARCDTLSPMSWSQKDGSDQVTNFDFSGNPIINPSLANWRVNQGPIGGSDSNEYIVSYDFFCFMFVPASGVSII